jgi:HSP20 family molecular chaperone IbpA
MAKETTSDLQTQEKQAVEREGMRPGLVFRPDVDIVERPDAFLVMADVPGVDEQNINVRLEEGVLSIDATQATEVDPTWTPIHAEYRVGGYHREFTLSEAIDGESIQAEMRDGVLALRLPKSDKHRPRQIAVKKG